MINFVTTIVFGLQGLSVFAGEWQTAGGHFCIDKCRYHHDQYFFYWCHVSDETGYYSDQNSWGSWGYAETSPETHLKWDYCVPSITGDDDKFQEDLDVGGGLHWHDPNKNDTANENIIHPKGSVTALYKLTRCNGDCRFQRTRSICPVDSDHPLVFQNKGVDSYYCVHEERPQRDQLSARSKRWCQDHCRKENTDHYFCLTLSGSRDHCSPRPNVGSKGSPCAYPCELYEPSVIGTDYYFCYTTKDKSDWEYCGQWDVPSEKKNIIEFTRYIVHTVMRESLATKNNKTFL